MSVNASIMRWDNIRRATQANLLNPWVAVGTPFTVQPRIVKFVNTTDADIDISVIGLPNTEVDTIPARSIAVYDVTTNKSDQAGYLFFQEGVQIYANALSAPTNNKSFTIVILYGSEF